MTQVTEYNLKHYGQVDMKKIIGPMLMVMFCVSYTHPLMGVDEDYYIPYTDTYGYEYDPETGTFIKRDPAPAASESSQQQPPSHEANVSAIQQNETSTDQSGLTTESSKLRLPILFAVAILIGGGLLVLARRFSSAAQ